MAGTRIERLTRLFLESPRCPGCNEVVVALEFSFCTSCGAKNQHFSLEALQEAGWESVEDVQEDQCEDTHDFISKQEVDPDGGSFWSYCPHCGVKVEYKRAS